MTQGKYQVDHIIVFADELNRLAPRKGNNGIGEYLAQLARTTRDRGIVLFGAGQFRSGIHEDILKAATVHYSMHTPEHELSDRIYAPLSPEFKARLTQLEPGETLLQYPSLRTAVFARFPRPFVMSGARSWRKHFPPVEDRPLAECIHERLQRLDPDRPPLLEDVQLTMKELLPQQDGQQKKEIQTGIIRILRDVEASFYLATQKSKETPWQRFFKAVQAQYRHETTKRPTLSMIPTPPNFAEDEGEWDE